MAGPCVQIYLPKTLSPVEEARVRTLIQAIASAVEGDDFWIAQRPFFIRIREIDEEPASLVLDGWSPKGIVSYCAMCNDVCDHVLLAMLCCRTAQMLGGMIALDDISTITSDPSVLTFDGARPIEGYGYIVRPEFLGHWMGHPDFRLLK